MRFDEYFVNDNNNIIRMFHSTVSSGKRSYFEHHHTECELSVIVSGTGIYRLGKKEYDFKKDDVFLFAGNENHCITDIGRDTEFNILNIHFEPRMLWSYNGFGNSNLLEIFYSRTDSFSNRIDRSNSQTEIIRNLIFDIENEFKTQKPEYELIIKMDIVNILVKLIRCFGYVNSENKSANFRETFMQLEKAMNYIDENLENKISLDILSRVSAMNKTYFSTVFKKYNGISPWEYITIKRIEKAINMIKNSEANKLEIAQMCGFSSSSNFYKAFNKVTGKMPKDYE